MSVPGARRGHRRSALPAVGARPVEGKRGPEATRERLRLALLTKLARAGATLDLEARLAAVASAPLPDLADVSAVVTFAVGDEPENLVVRDADPARQPLAIQLTASLRGAREGLPAGARELLRAGVPVIVGGGTELARRRDGRADAHALAMRTLGVDSALLVPLAVPGRPLGLLALGLRGQARRFAPEDIELARELAREASPMLDAARVHRATRRALESRDETLAIVSHELGNFLASLRVSAHLIGAAIGPDADPRVKNQLEVIGHTTDHMIHLVDDLLDAATVDSGTFRVTPARQPAGPLVAEAVGAFGATCDGKSIEIEAEIGADAPEAPLDGRRVVQCLSNLLSNAVRFTPPAGRIRVGAHGRGDALILSVSDTGSGIAAERLPHLFERQHRGHPSRPGRAGLGLPIVRAIVQAHGGAVRVESAPGRGTTFELSFPTREPGAAGRRAQARAPRLEPA